MAKETKIEKVQEEKAPQRSPAYIAYEQLIEAYRIQNPVKYGQKKEELARKLALLA